MTDREPVVGVVGAGTMGAGIAQVAAWAGHRVLLYDIADEPVARGMETLARFVRRGAEKGRYASDVAEAAIARVTPTTALEDLAPAGLVIEAAPERLDLKRALFTDLEAITAPGTILASNTSTLSVAAIFGRLEHPERACGLHFFNPAPRMPLVEVIRGPATDPGVAAQAAELVRAWGKHPVEARDTPGFIVNRVARPFYGEALRLLGEGAADFRTIDRLVRDGGFPMGPFELMDLIGIDINFAAAESVYEGFFGDPRFRPHPIQRAMVESGRLGRKTGRGYYVYADGVSPAAPASSSAADVGSGGRDLPIRRVVVLGPPADGLAGHIASLFGEAGVEVLALSTDPGAAVGEAPVGDADAAIDATVAGPEGKRAAVALLERLVAPGVPIATCCHAAGATDAAAGASHPERIVGFALLAPWADRTSIECARAMQTADEAAAAAGTLWRRAGLSPVWVGDGAGLVLPRIVACLANEAVFALMEGAATAADIDLAMRLGTRYPRGPLAWAQEIGLERLLRTLDALADEHRESRYRAAPLLRRSVAAGHRALGSP